MFPRWCIGLTLSVAGLVASEPLPGPNQAWVLALDGRGSMVGDLKPEEFQVKVAGKPRPVLQLKTPAQTADAAQSWVLVFEPIRDVNFRAMAFIAAADFLTKVPDGDRVFMVARGKDSLESLLPGFSARRSLWAEALAKVPDLLPEALIGQSKETLQGAGFSAAFTDVADGPEGQEALNALLGRFKGGAPGWARGTVDLKGVKLLDRLNFDNPMFVMGLISAVTRETKVLGSVFDLVAPIPGQKHVIVFSRCEADDLSHPEIRRAMSMNFKREKGDAGGPRESAVVAHRDMTILHTELKTRAVADGITLFSVAGAGQNVLGHVGQAALATGGYAFPMSAGLEATFGQAIQVFGSRYSLQWSEEGKPGGGATLEITTTRKDVRVIARTLQ